MLLRVVPTEDMPAAGVLLTPGVALILIGGPLATGAPLLVGISQKPISAPYGSIEVGTAQSPARIVAFRLPASNDRASLPLFRTDGSRLRLDPVDFDVDISAFTTGLNGADRGRVLDFLLNFCAPAFRLRRSLGFAQSCAQLALDCCHSPAAATPIAQVLPGLMLVEGLSADPGAFVTVIGQGRVVLGQAPVQPDARGLQIVPQLDTGDLIVATGSVTRVWRAAAVGALPHVLGLSEAGSVPASLARAACRRALSSWADPTARALLRDMELLHPARPFRLVDPALPVAAEIELALPDADGGLFVAGWWRDPLDRLAEVTLETAAECRTLCRDQIGLVRRPDVEARFGTAAHAGSPAQGFLLHVPEVVGGDTLQPTVVLHLKSGADIRLTPPSRSLPPAAARDAVLGCVAPGALTPEMMRRWIAPAAERLHYAAIAQGSTPERIRLGRPIGRPPVSMIIPLYRNLNFLRLQCATLAEDSVARGCELIFVLDSPEQRGEVEHLLRGLHRLIGMPLSLLVMPRNMGYAAACNAGAAIAQAPMLLLLNSDVVPAAPGWLEALLAPLQRPSVAAVGPKLLFEDDSIQHAGLCFGQDEDGVWFNRHFHKGMPRHWADAAVPRPVPGVTGAALLVRESAFQRVDGICTDYIIGDYEDSDFCLRLRAKGGAIAYEPRAELYHFERRSIRLHGGYTKTHASLYNRLLHHDRWGYAMAALMAEPRRNLARRRG